MKTPLRVSLFTVVLNAVLNIAAVVLLPVEWRHVGLAASTVFCAATGCVLLTVLARRKNGVLGLGAVGADVVRMTVAATVMAAALLNLKPAFAVFGDVVSLLALVAAGASLYGILAFAFFRRRISSFALTRKVRV